MNVFDLVAKLSLDLSNYTKGIEEAEQQGQSLGSALGQAGKVIAGAGAAVAGVGAGLFKFADNVAGNADEIDKMSQKLGLSTRAYQEWDYVLQISGADINSMSTGLKTLTNKFDDARNGSQSSIDTFERLGLSMEDISDLSREDLFKEVIFAFQDMEDSAERAALANDIFGKSGQELAPLFNTSREATEGLIDEVNELGGVMSDDAVKQGAEFKDGLTSLQTAFQGAGAELAKELLPSITDLVKKITDFVKSGGITKIINAFKKLSPVIAAATAAFVAYKAAMAITGVINALKSATTGMSTAQGILNAVMSANPFAAVATLIAGLVAGITVLWNTSDDFRGAVTLMFEDIQNFFGEFVEGVEAIFEDVPAFFDWVFTEGARLIEEAWEGITEFFSGLWEDVQGVFNAVGEWFGGIFSDAWDAVTGVWESVGEWFGGIWDDITGVFDAAVGGVVDFFGGVFGDAWEAITGVFSSVWDFFDGVFKDIKEALEPVVNFFKDLGERAWNAFVTSNPLFEALSMGKQGFADFLQGVDMTLNPESYSSVPRTDVEMGVSAVASERSHVNVYIGNEALDDYITTTEQRQGLRSGGR